MDRPGDEERPHRHCHGSATKRRRGEVPGDGELGGLVDAHSGNPSGSPNARPCVILVKKETQIGTRDGWSSDLMWTQCKPCVECFNQSTPVFDPSSSSTYTALSCSSTLCSDLPSSKCTSGKCGYTYTYGDSLSTQGVLAAETFTLAKTKLPDVAFGCGDTNEGNGFMQGAGLVGLGQGPLSLVSQLGLNKFSYCLTSLDDTSKSPLLLGSLATISESAAAASSVQTTPLIRNPSQPSFYYVNLKGLTVGSTHITLPSSAFAVQDNDTGGVIVDFGTSITYLELRSSSQ